MTVTGRRVVITRSRPARVEVAGESGTKERSARARQRQRPGAEQVKEVPELLVRIGDEMKQVIDRELDGEGSGGRDCCIAAVRPDPHDGALVLGPRHRIMTEPR